MKKSSKDNPFVGIAGTIGGISVAIVAVLALFAQAYLWVAVPTIAALALMGIFLGNFALRKK